jgi:chromosome partitioning protein
VSSGLGWPGVVDAALTRVGWPATSHGLATDRDVSRETSTEAEIEPGTDPVPTVEPAALVTAEDVSRETLEPATGLDETGLEDDELEQPLEAPAPAPTRVPATAWPAPARPRIISVANQTGGIGNTTTTVNLAAALALHGLKVLVVDLDPQGNASTAFSIDHHASIPSIYDVLLGEKSIIEVVSTVDEIPNLWCAPATIDLAGAEIELVSMVARESRLKRAIDVLGDSVDYVLIDCPPSLGLLTINAMVAAREVLIPIQCEFYALEGLSQLLNNINLVKSHLNPDLHVSTVLLTMYDARTRLADQVAAEVRAHFGDQVLSSVIPRSVRVSEAPGFGQTVITFDRTSRGARAYEAAAYDLAQRAEHELNAQQEVS